MKYAVQNSTTNVIEMLFDTPITPTPPLEVLEIPDPQWRDDMLGAIFINVANFKPYPLREDGDTDDNYWVSDGTNWVDPRADEEIWTRCRKLRNEELLYSDWTQIDDSPLNPPDKGLWTAYRQQLRNIPNANPNNPRAAEAALKAAIKDDKPQVGRNRD
jgi:hypothetical protein